MAGKKDKVKDGDRFSKIVPALDRCCICGSRTQVCIHECWHGTANRKKSKEDGLTVPLCFSCHQGTNGVHNNSDLDLYFKKWAEKVWIQEHLEECSDSETVVDMFIKRYGKNVLDDSEIPQKGK